jgi:4-amino-4-deoxy-L-arabinose transferase-like glycosyltransferase
VPWLILLLALAFCLRLAAAVVVQQRVEQTPGRLCLIAGDAEGYWELAGRLARGEEYAIYDPPRRVLRMPGFPLLLAGGIKLWGERVLATRVLLAVVGTAACGLVYWLTCVLFDRKTALVAGFMAAICPAFVVFSVLLLSETLFALCLLGSLIALTYVVRPSTEPSMGHGWRLRETLWPVLAGLLFGVATLVRPTWLLVAPGAAALHCLTASNWKRALGQATLMIAALSLTLAPWALRNARVTGHFVLTTLWVGASLYDGLNPNATGASDMRFVEEDGHFRRMTEYEADRHYRGAALDFVREHPWRTVTLAGEKLWRFWNPLPNAAQFEHPLVRWGTLAWTLPFLGLAALGVWHARGSFWSWMIPTGAVLYFSMVHLVFVGSLRYRLPAEYPLAAVAACGWVHLFRDRAPVPKGVALPRDAS